jgi:lipopolysaccharide transport system permease protein
MFYYGFVPSQFILILPFFVMMAFFAAIGVGFWVSALMVKYRDFRFIVPFLVQFGLYLSPVGFSSKMISSGWNLLYSVNPMVGIINGFRWSILGTEKMDWISMIISASGIILMTISGFIYFRSNERKFADVI